MEYYNFDLSISKHDDQYSMKARSEISGAASALVSLDLHSEEIKNAQERLLQGEIDEEFLKKFGGSLCSSLFQGDIRDLYRDTLGRIIGNDDRGLQIRLCTEPPEISALPWELLYDRSRDCFLATSIDTPLTRYIDQIEPIRNLKTELPINVLVAIPTRSGFESEREKAILASALQELKDTVRIDFLEGPVTRSTISKALIKERYHVFHFIGQGVVQKGESHLKIDSEENQGESDCISARSFAGFLREHPWMKLLVLGSCQGATISSTEALAGMASQLVKLAAPAVIAVQYPITARVASLFVKEFYCKLCVGRGRGRVDTAVSHARNRILMDFPDDKSFAAPALFTRLPTGLIFDLDSRDSTRTLLAPAEDIHRLRDVKKTHETNIAALKTTEEGLPATSVGEDMAREIEEEEKNVADVESKIRRHYKTVGALLLTSLIVFFAAYVGFLDVFRIDTWIERKFAGYMDSFGRGKVSRDVVLILANKDAGENGGLGTVDSSWRPYHAALIRGLADAGAKVIVLDFKFTYSSKGGDTELGAAIVHVVTEKKIPVIFGAGGFCVKDGEPVPWMSDTLVAILKDDGLPNANLINSTWGIVAGRPEQRKLRLAEQIGGNVPAVLKQTNVVPSLALQTVMQVEAKNRAIKAVLDSEANRILVLVGEGEVIRSIPVISEVRRQINEQTPCPPGTLYNSVDSELNFVIDIVAPKALETRPYHVIYEQCISKEPPRLDGFDNKIVLIGAEHKDDLYDISSTEQRSGVELQASAICNILEEDYIKSLPTLYQYLLILLMGAVGALMQTRFRKWMRFKITVVPPWFLKEPIRLPVVPLVTILVYLLIVFVVYKQYRLLLGIEYHVVALGIAYVMIGLVRKGITLNKT